MCIPYPGPLVETLLLVGAPDPDCDVSAWVTTSRVVLGEAADEGLPCASEKLYGEASCAFGVSFQTSARPYGGWKFRIS